MAIDYDRKRRKADRMIRKWGGPALLRRRVSGTVVDRECTAAIIQFTPDQMRAKMIQATERRALVSALAPDGSVLVAPDSEKDQLVTLHKTTGAEIAALRFTRPPVELAPDSTTVVFWDLTVSK